MRDILNRLGYRIKRIQKAKPLKKTKDTDAIFANVQAARQEYRRRPRSPGDLHRHQGEGQRGGLLAGGKKQDRLRGEDARGRGTMTRRPRRSGRRSAC